MKDERPKSKAERSSALRGAFVLRPGMLLPGETSLFVEFVVRAIDEGGQLETTVQTAVLWSWADSCTNAAYGAARGPLISASLPLSSDIFLAWCDNLCMVRSADAVRTARYLLVLAYRVGIGLCACVAPPGTDLLYAASRPRTCWRTLHLLRRSSLVASAYGPTRPLRSVRYSAMAIGLRARYALSSTDCPEVYRAAWY
eukprot:829023-Rhodomonas_salina.5